MARFARRFDRGQTVVLNDIGFVSYLADIRLIDVLGLGSNQIARRDGRWDSDALGALARSEGARIAIVYPRCLPGIPRVWTKVGEWELHDRTFALGGRTVVFFATDPSEAEPLRHHLEQFDGELPAEVTARIETGGAASLSASSR